MIFHSNTLTFPRPNPFVTHTHTHLHARGPIKCSTPPPVAKVTKPAHLQLPKSRGKNTLCFLAFVLHSGIDLPGWLAPFSRRFQSIFAKKQTQRKRPVLRNVQKCSLPFSRNRGAAASKTPGGIKTVRCGCWPALCRCLVNE